LVGDADGADVGGKVDVVAALVRDERLRCLWIRDERTEDVAARECEIDSLVGRRAGDAASGRIRLASLNRLRDLSRRMRTQRDREGSG